MDLFPIFLKLESRRCLVVGAGPVGVQKIGGLLNAGAEVVVVDPSPSVQFQELFGSRVKLREREYVPSDLNDVYLAIAATSDESLNQQIYDEAQRRSILVNVVDVPPLCDFYYGAVVRRGALVVAVSSQGESPHLAQRVRDEISDLLPEEVEEIVKYIGEERRRILREHASGPERLQLLRDLVYPRRVSA
ncbi:MAG TPA: bifunctional precorrin-2 dehydrogenase/sirohydrochlorin ferrochelatase [Terriglobales bacterium]|nr:bifunctional precorrin-2 dehydrogenase/sirohydrochlorin ferrochelatase [Terriglobales bacterium]